LNQHEPELVASCNRECHLHSVPGFENNSLWFRRWKERSTCGRSKVPYTSRVHVLVQQTYRVWCLI